MCARGFSVSRNDKTETAESVNKMKPYKMKKFRIFSMETNELMGIFTAPFPLAIVV